jgi:hypothetical protein
MAFSRKKLHRPAQAAFRLPPLFLHQSHEFDKEEFDKKIVAPRLEFPNQAACGLLFRSRPTSRACILAIWREKIGSSSVSWAGGIRNMERGAPAA